MTERVSVIVLVMLIGGATVGYGQVVGLKVTPTTIAPPQVDFDITVYATDTGNSPGNLIVPAPSTVTGYFGTVDDYTIGTTNPPTPASGTSTYFFTRVFERIWSSQSSGWFGFDTPNRPAVDLGDGSTEATASLALDATATGPGGTSVYRGSFSHSYGVAGAYTITARKGPDWAWVAPGANDSTAEVTTGAAVTGVLSWYYYSFYSRYQQRYYYSGRVTAGGDRTTNSTGTGSALITNWWTTTTIPYTYTVVSVNNTASTGQVPARLLRFDVE
jgi:hypothetical protein